MAPRRRPYLSSARAAREDVDRGVRAGERARDLPAFRAGGRERFPQRAPAAVLPQPGLRETRSPAPAPTRSPSGVVARLVSS